jgi:hypothetical protein
MRRLEAKQKSKAKISALLSLLIALQVGKNGGVALVVY